MADLLRQVLRVQRLVTGLRQVVQPFARVTIVAERFIKELTIGLLLQQRHQGGERGLDVPHQRHIDFAVRPDTGRVDVDLDDFGIGGVKRAIRELGTEQHQGVGVHHGVEPGREADQPGHPHVVRVIVLHMLFTAQGVNNRRLEHARKFQQLIMRTGTTAAAHQGNIAGVAQ